MRITMTIVPMIILRIAEAWLACFANTAERKPIKLPTRVDAATPGIVFVSRMLTDRVYEPR